MDICYAKWPNMFLDARRSKFWSSFIIADATITKLLAKNTTRFSVMCELYLTVGENKLTDRQVIALRWRTMTATSLPPSMLMLWF